MAHWTDKACAFGRVIRSEREVAFLLGAGCSISSGAPPTSKVHSAFEEIARGREDGQEIREFIHEIPDREVNSAIEPLFEDIHPVVGYRSLAALGRSKRVNVFNLNWDPLLERACTLMDIPFVSFDLKEIERQRQDILGEIDELPDNSGLIIAHAHGILGDSCRYSLLDTLTFADRIQEFISEKFLSHPLAVVGASINGETDIADLLRKLSPSSERWWYFGRESKDKQEDLRRLRQLKANPRQYCVDSAVDFDRFALEVLEETRGASWEAFREAGQTPGLPDSESLVLPDLSLLRGKLDANVIVILGDSILGKTVLASFLAHCKRLWSAEDIQLRSFDQPDTSLAGLVGARAATDLIVLENPFGQTQTPSPNPAFLPKLREIYESPDSEKPLLIITSRRSSWLSEVGNEEPIGEWMEVISRSAEDWYHKRDLRELADQDQSILKLIEEDEVRTPSEINFRKMSIDSGSPSAEGRSGLGSEILAVMNAVPGIGDSAALVRLQDFCPDLISVGEIERILGQTSEQLKKNGFLKTVVFEGVGRYCLKHSTCVEATDEYLKTHHERIQQEFLFDLPPNHPLHESSEGWQVSVLDQDPTDSLLKRWGTLIFSSKPSLEIARRSYDSMPDEWALTDFCYEFLRLWKVLDQSRERRELLEEILGDSRLNGTYAILEACLYLQGAAPREVRSAVENSCWKIVSDPMQKRQAALLVDGIMWRPLPGESVPEWVLEYLSGLEPESEEWGLIQFLKAYHPEGVALLPRKLVDRGNRFSWTEKQADLAAYLVQWHYAHQSYYRTVLGRARMIDKDFLCRSLHPDPPSANIEEIDEFLKGLSQFRTTMGWAIHAGGALRCLKGELSSSSIALVQELISQAPEKDDGVITAAISYNHNGIFRRALRGYFQSEGNRRRLFKILKSGTQIGESQIASPRFQVSLDSISLPEDLGITWPGLAEIGVDALDLKSVLPELRQALMEATQENRLSKERAMAIFADVARGDLRLLERHATAARGASSPISHVVDVLCSAEEELPLFQRSESE